MSDFKAKMHQIRFPLGSIPDPAGGAYSAPPDSLAVFKGLTSKEREGKGRIGKGKGGDGCPPIGESGSGSGGGEGRGEGQGGELGLGLPVTSFFHFKH